MSVARRQAPALPRRRLRARSEAARAQLALVPRSLLLRKYLRLCSKYTDVVERFKALAQWRSGIFAFAAWATQTRSSGVALIRNQQIVLASRRWRSMERLPGKLALWVRVGAHDAEPPITLSDVALREASKLSRPPPPGAGCQP